MAQPSKPAGAWAIIPARGGSVGIPRKNLQTVGGRPLIARTVMAARDADHVARVFVSTDDADIAACAKAAGAEIIERPADIAGATASSEAALLHGIEALEAKGETLPDWLVFLQCTSPFLMPEDVDGTVNAVLAEKAESGFAAAPSHRFLWKRGKAGAEGINHDKSVRLRRQDMEPEFAETGAVYVMSLEGFRASKHRFFGRTALYEMPPLRAMEIDDPEDLALARALAGSLEQEDLAARLPWPIRAIVFDFDGVMTDDRVIVTETGEEAVICSRSDGMGIEILRKAGLKLGVISKERNPVVTKRCEKLRIDVVQAVDAKGPAIEAWAKAQGLTLSEIAFVGNDINDLPAFERAGCAIAVADAHPQALAAADFVLSKPGGVGAVRELCDAVAARAAKAAKGD